MDFRGLFLFLYLFTQNICRKAPKWLGSILDKLAAITSHIPNKYSQSLHFYGPYSNKPRGLRPKAQEKFQVNQGNATIFSVSPPPKKACSKKWKETKIVEEVIYDYSLFDYLPA